MATVTFAIITDNGLYVFADCMRCHRSFARLAAVVIAADATLTCTRCYWRYILTVTEIHRLRAVMQRMPPEGIKPYLQLQRR